MPLAATLQDALAANSAAQDEAEQLAKSQGKGVSDLDPQTVRGLLDKHAGAVPADQAQDLYKQDFGKPKEPTKPDYPSANSATPGQLDTLASAIKQRNAPGEVGPPAPAPPEGQVPFAPGKGPAPGSPAPTPPGGAVADAVKSSPRTSAPATAAPSAGAPAGDTPKAPTPDDATKRLQALADRAGERSDYQREVSKLDGLSQAYQQAYKETQDKLQLQELGERMGHALAQLGAGIQGQRTGYDTTTGLKFDKTDWTHRYESALGQLKGQLEDLRSQRGETARLQEGREREGAEATRELGRESTQRTDTQARTDNDLKVANIHAGATKYAADKGAESRENVAGTKADSSRYAVDKKFDSAVTVQGLRNDGALAKLGAGDKGKADQALTGVQQALDAYAAGNTKMGDRLMTTWGPKAGPFVDQKKVGAAVQQAKDSSGLFSSGDATAAKATLVGGPSPPGQTQPAPGQPEGTVKMLDPDGVAHWVPKGNAGKAKDKYKWTEAP